MSTEYYANFGVYAEVDGGELWVASKALADLSLDDELWEVLNDLACVQNEQAAFRYQTLFFGYDVSRGSAWSQVELEKLIAPGVEFYRAEVLEALTEAKGLHADVGAWIACFDWLIGQLESATWGWEAIPVRG